VKKRSAVSTQGSIKSLFSSRRRKMYGYRVVLYVKERFLMKQLSTIHSDKLEMPLSFFQDVKAKIEKRVTVNSLFKKQSSDLDKESFLIAKISKPHSIGETLIEVNTS